MPKYWRMNQTRGQGEHGGIDTKRAERVIPIRGLAESYVGRLGRFIPFIDRHAHGTRRMARVEHRLIARIEIAYWTERGECCDIDKGIIRHGKSLLAKAGCALQGSAPVLTPGYWIGVSSSRLPGTPRRRCLQERKSSSSCRYVKIARMPAPLSLRAMAIGNG